MYIRAKTMASSRIRLTIGIDVRDVEVKVNRKSENNNPFSF